MNLKLKCTSEDNHWGNENKQKLQWQKNEDGNVFFF